MEREAGDKFECDGITLEVKELENFESDCYFWNKKCEKYIDVAGECSLRTDRKSVIFVKVGE